MGDIYLEIGDVEKVKTIGMPTISFFFCLLDLLKTENENDEII